MAPTERMLEQCPALRNPSDFGGPYLEYENRRQIWAKCQK